MTTTTMTSFGARRFLNLNQLKRSIAEWRWRMRSRYELEGLSDATLRDIGVTRCDVHREVHKPFWMA